MIHPPHVTCWDVADGRNVDRQGVERRLDDWRVTEVGLYVAVTVPEHPRVQSLQSWLLPDRGLRITAFAWRPQLERDYDYYIDVCDVTVDGTRWKSVDHYLDIIVRTGREARVEDADEFVAAVLAGHLGAADAQRALEVSYRTLTGLAAHGFHLDAWLDTLGITLRWYASERQ
ncbi:DUF402 domain-containing protein [Actinopolymorpha sp. B11F2]|uniref:DUF402 domain-containing protein n=1 Tax=Actinopolymorpha sp. B11F2 TaxID=3160862 RepID=UPI0032E39EE9